MSQDVQPNEISTSTPMGEIPGEIKWYDEAYSEPSTRVERGFYWDSKPSELVKQLFEHYKGNRGRALDVACGDGPHLEWLVAQGFEEVCGADFNQSALTASAQRVPVAKLALVDLTARNSLGGLGVFDLLVLHSITDHIRPIHRSVFLENLRLAIKPGGSIIMVEFAPGLVGIPDGQTWKEVSGHYSAVFTLDELESFFPGFATTARVSGSISDLHKETIMNGVLLQKPD